MGGMLAINSDRLPAGPRQATVGPSGVLLDSVAPVAVSIEPRLCPN